MSVKWIAAYGIISKLYRRVVEPRLSMKWAGLAMEDWIYLEILLSATFPFALNMKRVELPHFSTNTFEKQFSLFQQMFQYIFYVKFGNPTLFMLSVNANLEKSNTSRYIQCSMAITTHTASLSFKVNRNLCTFIL